MTKYLYINQITRDLEESSENLVALESDGSLPAVSAKNLIDLPSANLPGRPADYISDVYRSATTLLVGDYPIGGTFDGTNELLPINWVDDTLEPVPGEYVWKSTKRYIPQLINGSWVFDDTTVWSTPIKHLYIPTIGIDYSTSNSFTSYIFRKELVGITPATPLNGSYDGTTEVLPTLPAAATDNPPIQAYNEVIWVSTRTYTNLDGAGWTAPAWSPYVIFSAKNGLSGYLTNDNYSANAESDGTLPDLSGAAGDLIVEFGGINVTSNSTFAIQGSATKNGLTIAIDSYGHYICSATNWTSLSETFNLIATYDINGSSILKTFTITKALKGVQGIKGDPGQSIVVSLESSDGTVFKNNTGTPKIITAFVYIGGVKQTNTGGYTYKWFNNTLPIYVDGSNNYIGTTQTGGLFKADGIGVNTNNIIVGPEDVSFNNNLNIICEVVGI